MTVGSKNNIIPILVNVFDSSLKGDPKGYEATFTSPHVTSTRFARSASNQYYSYIESLLQLSDYVKKTLCLNRPQYCVSTAEGLLTASSLDIDYDYISRIVVCTAYWAQLHSGRAWDEVISKESLKSDRIEIGVFSQEEATSQEEIKLGGVLMVVGDNTKPSPTLFSFPSRHHTLPKSSFRASFDKPLGLHPILRMSLDLDRESKILNSNPTCALHAYLTLPSPLFLDKYAFTDRLFLESHKLRGLRSVSGATELEAPDWAVSQWGSASLFELQPLKVNETGTVDTVDVTIPLHSRYMSPTAGGYINVDIPYPVVFYACKAIDEDSPPLSTNPFDRTNLGYDGLFGERTIFYHVSPRSHPDSLRNELKLDLTIPVLDLNKASHVEPVTVLVILLGSLWICWKLFGPLPPSSDKPRLVSKEKHEDTSDRKKVQ